jgi:beta-lactam-binding protein with PASTA domain
VIGSLGDNPINIPTFRDRASAEAFVRDNGLNLKNVDTREDKAPEGTILRQSPSPNSQFGRGCRVDVSLVVAIPIIYVDIEKYVDMPEQEALQRIRGIGLNSTVSHRQVLRGQAGMVLEQSPPYPNRVPHGSFVSLVVSSLAQPQIVIVPALCGMDRQAAIAALESRGLVPEQVEEIPAGQESCRRGVLEGQVMWQDRPAGTKVQKGTRVRFAVVQIGED